jgi:biopolymer transport protein ExbB/TolQ
MTAPTAFETGRRARYRFESIDPERRVGLPSGIGTAPSATTTILLMITILVGTYGGTFLLRGSEFGAYVWELLTAFQRIPIFIACATSAATAILVVKWLKIRSQRRLLQATLVPEDGTYRITAGTVEDVLGSLTENIDLPDRFLLSNRIDRVLRNVRNVGRVADIDEMFASAADADESRMESSYTILRGLVWAIPVLGFIGTILGLTMAISEFQGVLEASGGEKQQLVDELGDVIAGLGTAFVTTGEGLVSALALQLGLVMVRRADESLLDDIRDYCTTRVLSLVRIDGEG